MHYVYRIQSWPGYREDANGVDLLSLREANAGDLAAFRDIFAGYRQGGSLALRFRVWRLIGEPNSYCNCNFEVSNAACRPPIADEQLKMCMRRCLTNGKACMWSGFDSKSEGHWYAFPQATEFAPGKIWKKMSSNSMLLMRTGRPIHLPSAEPNASGTLLPMIREETSTFCSMMSCRARRSLTRS